MLFNYNLSQVLRVRVGVQASKFGFYMLIEALFKKKKSWCETIQKYVPLVKQNVMKLEVFIFEGQRIDQKRKKGWWRG